MIVVDSKAQNVKKRRMLSFPTTFDRGGSRLVVDGIDSENQNLLMKYYNFFQNNSNNAYEHKKIKTMDIGGGNFKDSLMQIMFNENFTNGTLYNKFPDSRRLNTYDLDLHGNANNSKRGESSHYFENPLHFPAEALRAMNTYRYKHDHKTRVPADDFIYGEEGEPVDKKKGSKSKSKKINKSHYQSWVSIDTTLSMFNPNFNVQVLGMAVNVPLLSDVKRAPNYYPIQDGESNSANDLSDCSIRKLVYLSNAGLLGSAIYRYADFMYCKDLGKVSNNYLITLRKFNLPVGDHISFMHTRKRRKKSKKDVGYDPSPELGHLVTWFGTDDNKIEDILKYSYKYTWKALESKRQDLPSQEDNEERGVIGMLTNSFSPAYNAASNAGIAGTHNLVSFIWPTSRISSMTFGLVSGQQVAAGVNQDRLRQYDHNKVYAPQQTIRDMHIPDGQLVFSHEFTLTFSYKMRAYENINQKSAFLDLINNILKVTYFDGRFWGGSRHIIGPQPNPAGYRRANAMINKAFDKVGGFISALANGTLDFDSILGTISSLASEFISSAKSAAKSIVEGIQNEGLGGYALSLFQKGASALIDFNKKTGISDGIKGALKNTLGRPAFYAFDSLLSGDDTGLWHVTIGNPRNPIVSMGNLIVTNSSIQHIGPLGIDDFPTELKVTVSLKHARSRDAKHIGRMYTQGISALSFSQQSNKYEEQRNETGLTKDEIEALKLDKYIDEPHIDITSTEGETESNKQSGSSNSSAGNSSSGQGNNASGPTVDKNFSYQQQSKQYEIVEDVMYDIMRRDAYANMSTDERNTFDAQVNEYNRITSNPDDRINSNAYQNRNVIQTNQVRNPKTLRQTDIGISRSGGTEGVDLSTANEEGTEFLYDGEQYMYARAMFHNGADNAVAIMTCADQDLK